MVAASRPVRVLHVIAGLGGGGSERLVWDIVRLSDPAQSTHLVVTVFPDHGDFVYASRLAALGAHVPLPNPLPIRMLHRACTALAGRERLRVLRRAFYALSVVVSAAVAGVNICTAYWRFRPDVVNGHTSYGVALGALAAVLGRRPFVHMVPCALAQLEGHHGWMKQFYRRCHGAVHCFVTAMPDELRSLGVPPSKITELLGRIDTPAADSVRSDRERHYRDMRERLRTGEDAIIALSVGRLHPSKGHRFAVDAMSVLADRLPQIHWVVLGEGGDEESLRAQVARLGLQDRVHFLGFRPEPLPYYAAADIYFRTTTIEADNLSSYQAMAIGLPVVGFDTGVETEMMRKVGHGTLVPTGDAAALAAAAERILTLPDRGRSIGERGVAHARAELDVRRTAEQFTAVNRAAAMAHVARYRNAVAPEHACT